MKLKTRTDDYSDYTRNMKILSEHFVKSDCLRLEKIETSYCNLNVKSFALFRSFCIRESSL